MAESSSPNLLAQLKASKRLPSPPGVAVRVLELCRRDDTEMQDIADVLMSDPALAGRLLKYANSAIVGINREISSVRDAVLLLGLRAVKLTALGFSLATPDAAPKSSRFDLKKFWVESFVTAAVARGIAREYFKTDREEAFTAGLLAHIGRLAFAQGLPEDYNRVLEDAEAGVSLIEAERKHLGLDHVQFGAQLLGDWGLPEVLVEAVGCQLHPDTADKKSQAVARVVHAARLLSPVFVCTDDQSVTPEMRIAARNAVENLLKIDEAGWKQLADEILADYLQVAGLFDISLDSQASVLDLYAEAQEEASRVGMVAQLEQNRTMEANRELLRRATTDALTGIANRAKFDDRLDEALKTLRRGHGHFCILLVDVDHFKKFNDTYGHEVGDLVLKNVATALGGTLRELDLVARYGGEEFVVLAPHTDRKGACIVAARLCKTIEQLRVEHQGKTLGVTISVGLAITADYPSVPSAEQILADADKQLYKSKHAGRNTWSYLDRTASVVAMAQRRGAA